MYKWMVTSQNGTQYLIPANNRDGAFEMARILGLVNVSIQLAGGWK